MFWRDIVQTAIVTGPTGVLGTALREKLLQEGVETYVICHPGSKRTASIQPHPLLHIVDCDMSDYGALPDLIGRPCEAFFHLAWLGTADPLNRMNMHLQTMNIKYTLEAAEAAHALQCRVFVGAGSQAEYGRVAEGILHPDTPANPVGGYGMAKLCAGQMTRAMCKSYGIRHIWPRVVSVYGPGDGQGTLISSVIRQLLEGKRPALTAGEQIWDYLCSADAAEAFYQMAERGRDGAVYVLGSGRTRRLREFIEIIRDAIDPALPLGFGERPYYPDQAMHLEADISALSRDTGWKPNIPFAEGIKRLMHEQAW